MYYSSAWFLAVTIHLRQSGRLRHLHVKSSDCNLL